MKISSGTLPKRNNHWPLGALLFSSTIVVHTCTISFGLTSCSFPYNYNRLLIYLQKDVPSRADILTLKCRQLLPLETSPYEVICMQPGEPENGSSTPLNKDKADDEEHIQQVFSFRLFHFQITDISVSMYAVFRKYTNTHCF